MTPTRAELEERIRKAIDAEPLDRASAAAIAEAIEAEPGGRLFGALLEAAREVADRGHGRTITVSRNVFLPITNLCRNRCGYCTFAVTPDDPRARTYRLDEVRRICEAAAVAGCTEALLCLGDKPEIAYRSYRDWLHAQGHATTAQYLVELCEVALEAGLLPHTNAGVLTREELAMLRPVNASLGLMLETVSARLRERGQAHYYAPDKEPAKRIRTTREAGELGIAFTSGLLLGIGETAAERVDTLLAIRDLNAEGRHIQEVIVQGFHPKEDTPMGAVSGPTDGLVAGMVALARLVLGPAMNVQAPPNLSPTSLELLLRAGANDWGGVSPVSIDFINPEAPWPALDELRERTERAGYRLRERLCAYPELVTGRSDLFAPEMLHRLRDASDGDGYARPRATGVRA